MNVRNKGIQATSCKHLRQVRGAEAEFLRCEAYAAVVANPSSKSNKNSSIPTKISLAQQWTEATDPTGYLMSEKLDGMRAYWCGKKLWSRSGLPIIAPEWFLYGLPETLVLDGELFLGRQRFDECMMIARRTGERLYYFMCEFFLYIYHDFIYIYVSIYINHGKYI